MPLEIDHIKKPYNWVKRIFINSLKKMKSGVFLVLTILLFSVCVGSTHRFEQIDSEPNNPQWKIGGKIHFEEESGADFIGIKEINRITRNALNSNLVVKNDICFENAKILLKKENGDIILTHYEEARRPGVGEEMHATILYTKPRGFCESETLAQVSDVLFPDCKEPPSVEDVAQKYDAIIKSTWRFKISEIIITRNENGPSFITAKLLFNDHENLHVKDKPISAGLHITLVNCVDSSILDDSDVIKQLQDMLSQRLGGKQVKVASKNGVTDLEFGLSGSSSRIRAAQRIELEIINEQLFQ